MSWAERYRPRRFEEVVGQGMAVRSLSKLLRTNPSRPVAFYGPTGAGKTTLAQIYAKALLCDVPAASGSPCGVCDACELFERGRQSEMRRYGPALQNAEELHRIVNEIQPYMPFSANRRVFLFDEAGRLGTRLETLYEELETPRHGAAFLFTLLDLQALPQPAVARQSG